MNRTSIERIPYVLIAIGVGLAFISAVVPHYSAGYRLAGGVLTAGLLPYLMYGLAAPLLRTNLTRVAGVLLVGPHAVLVIATRFRDSTDYSEGLLYSVPLVLALAMLPLLVIGLSQPWGATAPPKQTSGTE